MLKTIHKNHKEKEKYLWLLRIKLCGTQLPRSPIVKSVTASELTKNRSMLRSYPPPYLIPVPRGSPVWGVPTDGGVR